MLVDFDLLLLVLNGIKSQFFENVIEFEFDFSFNGFVAENEHFLYQI